MHRTTMSGYRERGNFRRGSSRRPAAPYYNRRDNARIPRMRPDHLLIHDGSAQGLAVARANEEIRLAKDWKTFYGKMFEKEEVKIPPPNNHEAPGADVLNERIDRVIQATLGE